MEPDRMARIDVAGADNYPELMSFPPSLAICAAVSG
jgi:hypothetical protein